MKLTKVLLAGLVMISIVSRAQEAAAPDVNVRAGLSPGDEVDVRMFDFPDLGPSPVRVHVRSDGSVHLPYAGDLHVTGLSPDQFEEAVVDSLRTRGIVKQPNVMVDVVSAVSMLVHVLGEVKTPRAFPVTAPVSMAYVLSEVGGVTGLASHQLTILHRGEEAPTMVDFDQDTPTTQALNTLVRPGDIINVSRLGIYFVAGEVNRPGIFPLGAALNIGSASAASGMGVVKNITLLEALAQAGGITPIAARSKMRIIRTIDGKREEIIVDQVKLYKGEVADPVLHPNDIIYVPSSYLRLQTNNLFTTALNSLYASLQLNTVVNK